MDEIEERKAEVRVVGTNLEKRLQFTPKNQELLENWLFYVKELAELEKRKQNLNKRAREIRSMQKYIRLKAELNRISSTKEIDSNFQVIFLCFLNIL